MYIDKTAEVSPNAKLGKNISIWNWSKIREGAVLGDNVKIGQCVYIDKNVIIGSNVKIQNCVSIYLGVTIESNVFIGPNVTFTNDKFPRSKNEDWKVTKTIKNRASIGAGSTIVCGCIIGENSMIGAGSVVTKNVEPNSMVYGLYAKEIKKKIK